jgi:methyl-accepting chemotaxis protein
MIANAETANTLINDLNSRVQQLPPSDQRFEQFQAITAAKEAFLLARYEVRGYYRDHQRRNRERPSPNWTRPSPA